MAGLTRDVTFKEKLLRFGSEFFVSKLRQKKVRNKSGAPAEDGPKIAHSDRALARELWESRKK